MLQEVIKLWTLRHLGEEAPFWRGQKMLKVVAKMSFAPEAMEKVMPLVEELVAATVKEEGCISYNFCLEAEATDSYAMIESWATKEALDAHSSSEHFIRILPQLRDLGQGTSQLSAFVVLV